MGKIKSLKSAINIHWLRPDNALWVYGFSHIFGDLCSEMTKKGRTMDLGCGDGTTSAIMLGNEFDRRFDVYHSIQTNVETMVERSSSGSLRDEDGDFYNTYTEKWANIATSSIKKTSNIYSVGADWKDSLTRKASDLDVYDTTSVFDANIAPYPFEDGEFNFIFSTIIYWLKDSELALKEAYRILDNEGLFAFSAPKPEILDNTLVSLMKGYDYPMLDRLDRGRHQNWKRNARGYSEWNSIISKSGFEVIDYKEFHPSLQIAFGEFNIRTLLGSYKVLYDRLLPENEDIFLEFKNKWCTEIEILLTPFTDDNYYDNLEKSYHSFILRKK